MICLLACLNLVIFYHPLVDKNIGTDGNALFVDLCATVKRLISASRPEIALDSVLTSLLFIRSLSPSSLCTWQEQFSGWRSLKPLILNYHEDLLPSIVSTLVATYNSNTKDINGILLLYGLVNFLQTLKHKESSALLIRLLTIGSPSALSVLTEESPTNLAASLLWVCLKLATQLRETIHQIQRIWHIVGGYVSVRERSLDNEWSVGVMAELSDQIADAVSNSDENYSSSVEDTIFVLRIFVNAAQGYTLCKRLDYPFINSLFYANHHARF